MKALDLFVDAFVAELGHGTDTAVVCLFTMLGLTLSASVLSYVSSETIGMMFSSIG